MPYQTEPLPNGLIYVRCMRSGLQGCYHSSTGRYAHGDLRAPTLALLLTGERKIYEWTDYLENPIEETCDVPVAAANSSRALC